MSKNHNHNNNKNQQAHNIDETKNKENFDDQKINVTAQGVKGEDVCIDLDDKMDNTTNEQMEELTIQLQMEKQNAENFKRMAIQMQADFDNYRKRNQNIESTSRLDGIAEAVKTLLPAYDAVVEAQKQITDAKVKQGLEMVERAYINSLKSLDISPIDTLGEQFNPAFHNAIMTEEAKGVESGTILEEIQRGFIAPNGVLRCAIVKIAK